MNPTRLLYRGSEWNFDLIRRLHDAIEEVALDELGLDVYHNQMEVITSEQMLDAYAAIGMPLMYRHWSFGKKFAREELLYRKGAQSLAYELVINSDPCVSYIMEENTATMQALVIAHAAFGHNHFFKNNQLFRQWTRADRVLDELTYAKNYLAECEQRYGIEAVESLLDSAHALMSQGVDRYAPRRQSLAAQEQKAKARRDHFEANYNDLWRTVPSARNASDSESVRESNQKTQIERAALDLPRENLLGFLAQHALKLKDWQREVLEIVRRLAQYFYPQRQTKLMNEGCATFTHYEIMNRMYDRGQIDEGAMLEFLHMHSAVVTQPPFDSQAYSGINPYALGFAMMRDIQRICDAPDDEDHQWFPEFAGNGDAMTTLRNAWAEFRDESFVLQFLSPRLIREMRLFLVGNRAESRFVTVDAIHDDSGYRDIRRQLASQYDLSNQEPDIEVTDCDLKGSRRLVLTHRVRNGKLLNKEECNRTLRHVANLWGYRVKMLETDVDTGITLDEFDAVPMP
ncbi:SpoVR family protein [Novipirellula artificiosorum]|uniref:SpoVR family protein n=1 Tax=Novipirellula artificiosorum TaxID=2528016 RepID=A0A5C6DCL0_9BACT|nr:SpoVR family protein [Novipirellula artificiosorum]TWU34502.1 SpoVR family protein [Novipirellula artificiosorum]